MVFLKAQLSGRMDDPEYLIKCLIEKLENDISKAESHLSDKKPRQSKGKSLAPFGRAKAYAGKYSRGQPYSKETDEPYRGKEVPEKDKKRFEDEDKKQDKLLARWNKMKKVSGTGINEIRESGGREFKRTKYKVADPNNKNKETVRYSLVNAGSTDSSNIKISTYEVIEGSEDKKGSLLSSLKKLLDNRNYQKYFKEILYLKKLVQEDKDIEISVPTANKDTKGRTREKLIREFFEEQGHERRLDVFDKISNALNLAKKNALDRNDAPTGKAVDAITKVIEANQKLYQSTKKQQKQKVSAKYQRDSKQGETGIAQEEGKEKVNAVTLSFYTDLKNRTETLKGIKKDSENNINIISRVLYGNKKSKEKFNHPDFIFSVLTNLDMSSTAFENKFPEFVDKTSELVSGSYSDEKPPSTSVLDSELDRLNEKENLTEKETKRKKLLLIEANKREELGERVKQAPKKEPMEEVIRREREQKKISKADSGSIIFSNDIKTAKNNSKIYTEARKTPYTSDNPNYSRLKQLVDDIVKDMGRDIEGTPLLEIFTEIGEKLIKEKTTNKKKTSEQSASLRTRMAKLKAKTKADATKDSKAIRSPRSIVKEIKDINEELGLELKNFRNVFHLTDKTKVEVKEGLLVSPKEINDKINALISSASKENATDKQKDMVGIGDLYESLGKALLEINLDKWYDRFENYVQKRDGVEKQIDEIRNGISDIEFQREIKDMVKISQSFEKYKKEYKIAQKDLAELLPEEEDIEYGKKEEAYTEQDIVKIKAYISKVVDEFVNGAIGEGREAEQLHRNKMIQKYPSLSKVSYVNPEKAKKYLFSRFYGTALIGFEKPKAPIQTKLNDFLSRPIPKRKKVETKKIIRPPSLTPQKEMALSKAQKKFNGLEESILGILEGMSQFKKEIRTYKVQYKTNVRTDKHTEDKDYKPDFREDFRGKRKLEFREGKGKDFQIKIIQESQLKGYTPETKRNMTKILQYQPIYAFELKGQIDDKTLTIAELMDGDYSMNLDTENDYKRLLKEFNKLEAKIKKDQIAITEHEKRLNAIKQPKGDEEE